MHKSPFFFIIRRFTKDKTSYLCYNNDKKKLTEERYPGSSLGTPIGPSVFWEWEDE